MAGGCLLLKLLDQQIQLLLLMLLMLLLILTSAAVHAPTPRHSQEAYQATPLQEKNLQL